MAGRRITREEYIASRSRFGESQFVTFNADKYSEFEPKEELEVYYGYKRNSKVGGIEIQHGFCPCGICNHELCYECDSDEEGDYCQCCSWSCS